METAENVATITNFTVFTAPALAVEVAVLAALGVFYFAALHTRLVKSEWLAMRLFMGFRPVWRWLVAGLVFSSALFAVAMVLTGPSAVALRDTGITLFLFIGWSGILCAAWSAFAPKPKKPKKRRKGKRTCSKRTGSR